MISTRAGNAQRLDRFIPVKATEKAPPPHRFVAFQNLLEKLRRETLH